jgi:DNA-directed RNA polymerase subunit L
MPVVRITAVYIEIRQETNTINSILKYLLMNQRPPLQNGGGVPHDSDGHDPDGRITIGASFPALRRWPYQYRSSVPTH